MAEANSNAGSKLFICVTPQNADLAEAAFAALTFVQVKGVGSVGEFGITTNPLTYDTWDTNVALKAKGITDAGSPDVEVARNDADPGQIAMAAAGLPDNFDNYAFKVERQSGTIEFIRGLVAGPRSPNGRNEDFDLHVYTLMLNQLPVLGD